MIVDAPQLWLICIAVSAPIAGVVGFAVQLRTIKNLRLENEKLELEIENLEREKEEAQRRIVIPTTEEVEKYNEVMFSRRDQTRDADIPRNLIWKVRFYYLKAALKQYAIYFLIVVFLLYLIFDVYRVSLWLWSLI